MTPVLAYHKVDDRFELGLTNVKPKVFRKHIESIRSEGYRIQCALEPAGAKRTVCLTFDDGYECFYRHVVPSLESVDAKAIVFVITDFIGKTNSWDLRLSLHPFKHMEPSQVKEVARLGFQIGSHSCSHRDLTRLGEQDLKEELEISKRCLEDLTGTEVDAFSFPFGRYNRTVVDAAHEAGYRRLFGMGSRAGEGVVARTPVYSIDTPARVLRKLEANQMEIILSDFIHSFANISALLSVRKSAKTT